jgi:hypothetical protein
VSEACADASIPQYTLLSPSDLRSGSSSFVPPELQKGSPPAPTKICVWLWVSVVAVRWKVETHSCTCTFVPPTKQLKRANIISIQIRHSACFSIYLRPFR